MPVQGNPTPPLVGGNAAVDNILSNYAFQAGIHKPEHSSILTYKYSQYYVTSILDRMGAEEAVAQDVFSWNVMDRTRESGTVDAMATVLPAVAATFEVPEFTWANDKKGYLIVGDVIRMESGVTFRVDSTQNSGGVQEVTVSKVGGGNITATELANGMVFGHSHSMFGEGTFQPDGRVFLPTEEYNRLTILKRSISVTGSELTNKTWLGDGEAWYFEVEDITRKEFAKDRENLIVFGQLSDTGIKSTRGILDYALTYGIETTFASGTGVVEQDLRDHIAKMLIEGTSNEITILCGSQFLSDIQVALKDYALNGAIDYGKLGDNAAGLDFMSYKFMGKTLHFAYYELFDDEKILPFSGTPTAEKIDFSNFALLLDFGTDNTGRNLITLKYKAHDGQSRKFIQKINPGMMAPTGGDQGISTDGFDGFRIYMLSDIGVEVRLPNRLGIMRANS